MRDKNQSLRIIQVWYGITLMILSWMGGAWANNFPCQLTLWYEDLDHDGFGNPQTSVESCEQPAGYVTDKNDCNDNPLNRGTIFFPGAKEPCNYDDFNCDGKVRSCAHAPEGVPLSFPKDAFEVTSFENKHPFYSTPGGNHNMRDQTDVYPGIGSKQSVFIQSAGDGKPKLLRGIGTGPFDFSGKMPKVWIKLENGQKLKEFSFYLGQNNFESFVRLNLLSTQGQKWITEGDWVALTLSWSDSNISQVKLEPGMTIEDLRKKVTDFQLRVVDNAGGPVKLHINRISAVEEPRVKYPHGVISLTFDDNWATQYIHAKPKLDQYHLPATAYVIVGFLDTPNYMTTEQLRNLQTFSNWEIAYHAFDPIMHIKAYTQFSPEIVEQDMLAGRQWLWENGLGMKNDGQYGLAHFAYPKGEFKQTGLTDVLSLARKHFSSARSINERHRETLPPSDPHKLRVLYITASETVEAVMGQIERGIQAGEWIILVLHNLVEVPQQNDQWEISKFNRLIDFIGEKVPLTPVLTVGEVLGGG